jgi:ABC-type nitrate/sulfonate/bicarbonate transport system permease component
MNRAFIKMTFEDLVGRGVTATVADWPGYALVVSVLSGVLLGQLAFASGALTPAFAAMSVTNPLASITIGLLAFDASLPEAATLVTMAAATLVIAAGIVGLATASSTQHLYGAAAQGGQKVSSQKS